MLSPRSRPLMLVIALGMAFMTTPAPVHPQPNGNRIILRESTTIFDADSDVLGLPDELAVDREGRVFVLDYTIKGILRISADGSVVDTIGREGAGPGEFRRPWSIGVWAETLYTVDGGLLRLQAFDVSGRYLMQRRLPRSDPVPPIAIGGGGELAIGTAGERGALAEPFGPGSMQAQLVGQALGPFHPVMPLRQIQVDIMARRIPEFTRNYVRPLFAHDGELWLIGQANGSVEAFDAGGRLRWRRTVDIPDRERILEDFFARNRDAERTLRFNHLRLITDAKALGESVWLLVGGPVDEPTRLIVLARDGTPLGELELQGISGGRTFAVDAPRRLLYVASPEDAALHRVSLGGVPALWVAH